MGIKRNLFRLPHTYALYAITDYEATGSASAFSSGMSCLTVR
jgi:hypothetical protein